MTALLPPRVIEGGAGEAVKRLTDTKARREIATQMQERSGKWDNVLPENALHPRVWGTFARVLHWALEGKNSALRML